MDEHKSMEDIYFSRYVSSRNRMQKAYELWRIMLDDNHPDTDSFYEEYKMAKSSFEKARDQLGKMNSDL
jgi:hypothetical protein